MQHEVVAFVLNPTPSFNAWCRYFLVCWCDIIDKCRPRRQFYRRWKPLVGLALVIISLSLILGLFISSRMRTTVHLPELSKDGYHSSNLQIPRYFLFLLEKDGRRICRPMVEKILPNIESFNTTDTALMQSLFGSRLNPMFLLVSMTTKPMPATRGKLCSNASGEWALLTTLESNPSSENDKDALVSKIEQLNNDQQCRSFDFKQCPLNGLESDYPQIFELETQEFVKRTISNRKGNSTLIVEVIFQYIRRKAEHFRIYQEKNTSTSFSFFNITISVDFIGPKKIFVNVSIKQQKVIWEGIVCLASLTDGRNSRSKPFHISHPAVLFEQLTPSTSYNICVSCGGIERKCQEVRTAPQVFPTTLPTKNEDDVRAWFSRSDAFVAILFPVGVISLAVICWLIGSVMDEVEQAAQPNNNQEVSTLVPQNDTTRLANVGTNPGEGFTRQPDVPLPGTPVGVSVVDLSRSTSTLNSVIFSPMQSMYSFTLNVRQLIANLFSTTVNPRVL